MNSKTILKISTDNKINFIKTKDTVYNAITEDIDSSIALVKTSILGEQYYMIVDDDGYEKKLPANFVGSYLYNSLNNDHFIVGDIYIARDEDAELASLTNLDIIKVLNKIML